MKRKILTVLFVVSFAVLPAVTNAGFFDLFRAGQGAQVRTSTTLNTGVVGYKQGDQADVVLQVQQALSAQKLYSGAVSGVVGPRTVAAVKAWQKARGLSVTGVLDTSTIRSILGRDTNESRRSGGDRDGGLNSSVGPAPTLSYLQGRCNSTDPAWVRVISPWQGDEFIYNQDDIPVKIFVCDATGTNNTHTVGLLRQGVENGSAMPPLVLVSSFDDSDMTPYQANTWTIDYTIEAGDLIVGGYDLFFGNSGYYINGSVVTGANATNHSGQFDVVNELGGGGNCDSDNVELDILPLAYQMSQMDDFPVLEFRVDNQTDCEVALEDMTFVYMVTDTLPYFEEISVINKDTNMVVAEGMIDGSISGESLDVSFNGTNGYMIDEQDEQTFVLLLQTYNQPTQGALSYNDYINKNLVFGFPKINSIDFKFWDNGVEIPASQSLDLGMNRWGGIVGLPQSAF